MWPNKEWIYKIDEEFNVTERVVIREAMDNMENSTCIRFIDKSFYRGNNNNFITIKKLVGCWTYVGFY